MLHRARISAIQANKSHQLTIIQSLTEDVINDNGNHNEYTGSAVTKYF